jgi:hypothetical protein
MTPAHVDLHIRRGEPFKRLFIYQNPDGSPIDLTGWQARLLVWWPRSSTVLEDLSHDSGIVLGGEAGTILVELSSEQASAVPQINAPYELKLIDPLGTIWRPFAGRAVYSGVIIE